MSTEKARKRGRKRKTVFAKKLLRDMSGNAMQFIAMILLCFLGTWCFSGLDASWRLMDRTVETYFEECNLADFWVNGFGFTEQQIKTVKHIPGVSRVLPRTTVEADAGELGNDVIVSLECYESEMTVNVPYIRDGSLLEKGDIRGCLLEEQFAGAHGLSVGDRITFTIGETDVVFFIRGIVLSPEYTITSKDVAPDPEHYGFALVLHEAVSSLPYTDLLIDLEPDAEAGSVLSAIEKELPTALVVSQQTQKTVVSARSFPQMFHGLTYVFPILAYAVAAVIVVSTLKRMIDNERIEIGTFKSLGYGNAKIRGLYVWYALLPSVIGSLIGLYSGHRILPDILWEMVSHNSRYPYTLRPPISASAYVMSVFTVAISVLICVKTFNGSARESTADLLRPKPPKSGTRILLERWKGFWRRLSFNGKMVVRNLMRNKGRTAVMLVGIVCCNMLIIATFALKGSMQFFISQYYGGTLAYDFRVELKTGEGGTLESYASRLDAGVIEGVMDQNVSLLGGREERATLLTVLEDDQTMFRLGEGQKLIELPEDGVVISRKLASVMGIGMNERVRILLAGDDDPFEMTVSAFADTNVCQQLFMGSKCWERLRKGEFRPTALLIKDASDECLRIVDDMDEAESVKYVETQREQTMTILDATGTAFSIMSGVALGLAFVICYNMGLMNFTERIRDYATLKVLGYHQREIRRLMLNESCITAVIGVALGVVPGALLTDVILKTCEYDSMVFVSRVTASDIAFGCVITFVFTVFIEWLLTLKVRSIDMVEALKSVE